MLVRRPLKQLETILDDTKLWVIQGSCPAACFEIVGLREWAGPQDIAR